MLRGLRFEHMRSERRIPFSPREEVPEGRMRVAGFITDSDSREVHLEIPRPSPAVPATFSRGEKGFAPHPAKQRNTKTRASG